MNNFEIEWTLCKSNPLYFIVKYCNCIDLFSNTYSCVIEMLRNRKSVTFMAPRQYGKSLLGSVMMVWASVFFCNNKIVVLNMKKGAAINNLNMIRKCINSLPEWMVGAQPFKGNQQLHQQLFNDSRIDMLYPSTAMDPYCMVKSIISPIVWIDEAAYIPKMNEIWESCQPMLSKARDQALRIEYPSFVLVTSTPNGTIGTGEWFYKRFIDSPQGYWNSIEMDWREHPMHGEEWYRRQHEYLDPLMVAQEIKCLFINRNEILNSPCNSGGCNDFNI